MAERECDGDPDSHRKTKVTGVDFISSMPDAILQHILAYVPTKTAIKTSVLAKRWKHVWYGTPSVSIDCSRVDLVIPIDITLRRFSAPRIPNFELSICRNVHASHIDSWIEIATSHKAENLSLVIEAKYRFPDSFFVNSDVKKLNVTLTRFSPHDWRNGPCFDMIPRRIISWSTLRELYLNSWDLRDKSFAKILSRCKMLEILVLDVCRKLYNLDLSKSRRLKKFEMSFGDDAMKRPLEIVAPHIRYLKLTFCKFIPCTLVDVSSLTEAHFSLSGPYVQRAVRLDRLPYMVLKMLADLQHVEKLTLDGLILQGLSLAKICELPFPQFKTKELIVEMMVVQTVVPGFAELLKNSPELKKLTVYTMQCNAIPDEELDKYLTRKKKNPYECWSGFFPKVEETSSFSGGITEDTKSEHVASFMELVMRNSKALEMMTLQLRGYLSAREYQKLLTTIPSVSRNKNGEAKAILNSFKIIP